MADGWVNANSISPVMHTAILTTFHCSAPSWQIGDECLVVPHYGGPLASPIRLDWEGHRETNSMSDRYFVESSAELTRYHRLGAG
jgi:hypothetical protein